MVSGAVEPLTHPTTQAAGMRYALVLFGGDMKTDKELLELAAKAAGYEPQHYSEENNSLSVIKGCTANCAFSPLTDDGDALRLAVKLQILIDNHGDYTECYASDMKRTVAESHKDDPLAATRRAIVRAAAAIGEKL